MDTAMMEPSIDQVRAACLYFGDGPPRGLDLVAGIAFNHLLAFAVHAVHHHDVEVVDLARTPEFAIEEARHFGPGKNPKPFIGLAALDIR